MPRRETSRANEEYYRPAGATDYVLEPYHRLRRRLARDFALATLGSSPGAGATVVELGSGERPLLGVAELPPGSVAVTIDLVPFAGRPNHVVADLEHPFPLADEAVDLLVSGELIEHVFDIEQFVAECARVLRPGGHLVLTTPNLAAVQDRVRFVYGASPRQVDPLHPYLRFHIRPFTRSALVGVLTAAGFDVLGVRSNYVVWRVSGRRLQSRLLARLVPGLSGSLVVLARRQER